MHKGKTIEAVILSRKDIGEADRLLTVYSKNDGKINIIARGTRRLKSKNSGHIEPFTVGKYSIVQGKTFYVLTGAESQEVNFQTANDLGKYNVASYLCELVDIAGVENQKMPKVYNLLARSLSKNNKGEISEIDIRYFEFVLLSELGYKGNYQNCQNCGVKIDTDNYSGGNYEGIYCKSCKKEGLKLDINVLKLLRLMGSDEIGKIKSVQNIDNYNGQLREVITQYLYEILPRAPKAGKL